MSAELERVANRAATWSETASRLKSRLDFVRWIVFVLSISGALAAAIASQIPLVNMHAVLTALGTVFLAAATFASNRLLRDSEVQAWFRARAASEALKREAFRYATQAHPYDSGNTDQTLKSERERIEKNLDDLIEREIAAKREGSAPRAMLTPQQYRDRRLSGEVKEFFRPRALAYRKIAARLKWLEFALALAATIITALAGVIDKSHFPVADVHFDVAALTAVLTTISGSILAHVEASRYQHLITSYLATARRLEDEDANFESAKGDAKSWSDFVNKCEDIIAAENNSWVAKWTRSD